MEYLEHCRSRANTPRASAAQLEPKRDRPHLTLGGYARHFQQETRT